MSHTRGNGEDGVEALAPTESIPGPNRRHLPALDGVRGLAALGVAASHLFPGNAHSTGEAVLVTFNSFGATGVDLFFVLSGFLITGILYDSRESEHYFRNFYARRVLRIFPLYYAVLLVFIAVCVVRHAPWGRELASLALYLQNTSWIAAPVSVFQSVPELPLGHFWSLAIEEQFYLVWPLVVYFVPRRRALLGVCAAMMVLCPLIRYVAWTHSAGYVEVHGNTLCRADSLLLGGGVALLLRGRRRECAESWIPWLTFLLLPPLVFWQRGLTPLELSLRYSLLALGYAGLLGCAMWQPAVRAMCLWRPLRTLGRYSYGFYVYHLILATYLLPLGRAVLLRYATSSPTVAGIAAGVGVFFLALLVAMASYRLFEVQFLRLKRFFAS